MRGHYDLQRHLSRVNASSPHWPPSPARSRRKQTTWGYRGAYGLSETCHARDQPRGDCAGRPQERCATDRFVFGMRIRHSAGSEVRIIGEDEALLRCG